MYLKILYGRASIAALNNTSIALIPKIKNLEVFSDYRPVSLCNVLYNIVSKTLATYIKSCLHSLILSSQNAFAMLL